MAAVRRIRPEDWALVRELRLAALADAPDAFAATHAEESALGEVDWRERAQLSAEGRAAVCFLALHDGVESGLAMGIPLPGEPAAVELNSVWVAPSARGHGAARALVGAVCDWARERRAERVVLEVTETSTAALSLYRALGFAEVCEAKCGERRATARRMQKAIRPEG